MNMLEDNDRQARIKSCLRHAHISSYEIAKRVVKKALKDAEEMIDDKGVGNQIILNQQELSQLK